MRHKIISLSSKPTKNPEFKRGRLGLVFGVFTGPGAFGASRSASTKRNKRLGITLAKLDPRKEEDVK